MQEASGRSYRSQTSLRKKRLFILSERSRSPFVSGVDFTLSGYFVEPLLTESEDHPVRVAGVVVVAVPVVVDVAEVGRIAIVRRTKPPVVRGGINGA